MMQTRIGALQSTVDRYDIHYTIRKYKSFYNAIY